MNNSTSPTNPLYLKTFFFKSISLFKFTWFFFVGLKYHTCSKNEEENTQKYNRTRNRGSRGHKESVLNYQNIPKKGWIRLTKLEQKKEEEDPLVPEI